MKVDFSPMYKDEKTKLIDLIERNSSLTRLEIEEALDTYASALHLEYDEWKEAYDEGYQEGFEDGVDSVDSVELTATSG